MKQTIITKRLLLHKPEVGKSSQELKRELETGIVWLVVINLKLKTYYYVTYCDNWLRIKISLPFHKVLCKSIIDVQLYEHKSESDDVEGTACAW